MEQGTVDAGEFGEFEGRGTLEPSLRRKPDESSSLKSARGPDSLGHATVKIHDPMLVKSLDQYAIEDVVELKIARFLEQVGTFYPENMYELIMSKAEKPLLVQILRRVGGNQVQAAKILGINRNTLRKKIKLYGI